MIYATKDAEDGKIQQDAEIRAFATYDEARAWLLRGYDATEWDLDTAEIFAGRYGDAWLQYYQRPPHPDERGFKPFTIDQLSIEGPGWHPGGKAWWVTPIPDVLVAVIQARESEGDNE